MGSTSESELTQRIAQVAEWMLVPYTSSEIVRLCRTEWDVNRATSYRYIADANELIAAEAAEQVAAELRKAKSRYERYMRKAEERNELNVAVSAQEKLTKLMGVGAPEKSEVKHTLDWLDELVNSSDKPAPLEQN
jgi:hypothetical protein